MTQANFDWSPNEDMIIRKYYPTMSSKEIQKKYLPHRTYRAIQSRANKIGINKFKFWSKEELEILRNNYGKMPATELAELLPNRNAKKAMAMANLIGVNKHQWTNEELEILRSHYGNISMRELKAMLPNRSNAAIYAKANKLKLGVN